MNIAVIVPFSGKPKYQSIYDTIIETIEHEGATVLSPEKPRLYESALTSDTPLHDALRSHYEFIRKNILNSDAVIVEATWENFRVGHEATLALFYHKPVLALSQSRKLDEFIYHPGFKGMRYHPDELTGIIRSFLGELQQQSVGNKPMHMWSRSQKTILVFGGVCTDMIHRVKEIPAEEDVVISSAFVKTLGGKAANAAVGLTRLGNEVFLCGSVGYDTLGNDLEIALTREGIRTDFLHRDPYHPTSVVALTVNERAKYTTVVDEAANVHVSKENVDEAFKAFDNHVLHIDSVYLTLEQPSETIEYIIREAKKRKLFVFCDAAPLYRPLNAELLSLVDVVVPNQQEAEAMTGIPVHDKVSARRAARKLLQQGAHDVVITLGDKGAFHASKNTSRFIKAQSVEAIDEAGAGDAFRASYLHSILHGGDVQTALRRANGAGAFAVARLGSYDSMPSSEELDAFIV